MALQIKRPLFQAMIHHLQSALPLEACGLLAGTDDLIRRRYEVDNILRSSTAYEMDPEQQVQAMLDIEEQGLSLLAIYHSHPHGPAFPSETDVAQAYFPEAVYLIISLKDVSRPIVRAFRLGEGPIIEVNLTVV